MMGSFLDFISTSRDLLKDCLEICDSLEKDFSSEYLVNEIKNKKLNEMKHTISTLKGNILAAKAMPIKLRRKLNDKKQNGGCAKENPQTKKALRKFYETVSNDNNANEEKVVEKFNDLHESDLIDKLNHVAKEAILNDSDLEVSDDDSVTGVNDDLDNLNNTSIGNDLKEKNMIIDEQEKSISFDDSHDSLEEKEDLIASDCEIAIKSNDCSKSRSSQIDINDTIDSIECVENKDNGIEGIPLKNCVILLPNIDTQINDDSVMDVDEDPRESEKELIVCSENINNSANQIAIDSDIEKLPTTSIEIISRQSNDEIYRLDSAKETKECFVLLEDISKSDRKNIFDKTYFNDLEKDVNKLSQIPKFTNKNSMKNDADKAKKSKKVKVVDLVKESEQSESDNEDNEEDSDHISDKSVDLDINNTIMVDSQSSSSSDSEESSDDFKAKSSKRVDDSKSRANTNAFDRRITRSLRIPIMSESETSEKIDLSNGKSSKKGAQHKRSVVDLSSTSPEESDASASDLRKGGLKRKKSMSSKGKNKKQRVDSDDERKSDRETRKNIHKILTKSKLSEATKTAEQYEMDRRKRMEEKQEMYNSSLIKTDDSTTASVSSLVLEKGDADEYVVEVHHHIAEKLKKHQVDAVHFMYDCVIESVECLLKSQKDKDEQEKTASSIGGCILAHCMGLGKTLSLIAFIHTMLTTPVLNLYTCIVVCPVNTALNWKREWEMWVPSNRPIKVFEVCSNETKKFKMSVVQDWYKKGGVLIIGYEMFRLLATGDSRTIRSKVLRQKITEALINPGADFIVCDEGHLLKNEKSAISKVINKVKTLRRIVLTGTPLQNRLLEYHTMVNFVKPNLLGTHKEFLNRFVNPICNGQHINSTPYDVIVMKKRSHILFKTLDGCVHRRDYSALVQYLPPKYEYVIKIRMSDIQMQLYRLYLSMIRIRKQSLFQDQMALARIWTHPFLLCVYQDIINKRIFMAESDGESFLDDGTAGDSSDVDRKKKEKTKKPLEENNIISLISDESEIESGESKDKEKNKDSKKNDDDQSYSESSADEVVKNWSTSTRSNRRNKLNDSDVEPNTSDNFELENLKDVAVNDKHWWSELIKPENEHQIEISGKLTVLFQILRKAGEIGDKVIIFSQSLLVLDIIEKYLLQLHTVAEKVSEDLLNLTEPALGTENPEQAPTTATENLTVEDKTSQEFLSKIGGYNTWEKGLDYDRMDGSTQVGTRADIQARFNSIDDSRLRLFLISTRAGGMGINLVSANRVVIFDVSWNPSNDIQAIFRSYRFGQVKPVYVYRLVSQATMEEKMYERQVTKLSLALRVVDEQQISRHFTEEDLKSLYKFEPDIYEPDKERETPMLPKDRFLAELIKEFPQWIYGYHEHDSLLQNKDEEDLTESERQEAWKEFEDEKLHGGARHISGGGHGGPLFDIGGGVYAGGHLGPQHQMNIDPNHFAQMQLNQMMQTHPQYVGLFAQNYVNLLRYALNQQPDLKANPGALSHRMQAIFFTSLQKHNANVATPTVAIAPAIEAAPATEGDDCTPSTTNQQQE